MWRRAARGGEAAAALGRRNNSPAGGRSSRVLRARGRAGHVRNAVAGGASGQRASNPVRVAKGWAAAAAAAADSGSG